MLDIVKGRPTQKALRKIGSLSPGARPGQMAAHVTGNILGTAGGNPWLFIASAGTAASQGIAGRMTRKQVETLEDIVRRGGDLQAPFALSHLQRALVLSLMARGGAATGDQSPAR